MIFGKSGLFGRAGRAEGEDGPEAHGPLAVPLGGAVEIDLLPLAADAAGAEPGMPLPSDGTFVVVAYGEARLGESSFLSRYYDDDDRMLQVVTSGGRAGDALEDCSLYLPWDSVVPAGRSGWDLWTGPSGRLGQPTYDADGIVFGRFWGDGDGRMEPVEFVEDVRTGMQTRSIHQRCMLYARPLGRVREMLLIGAESEVGRPLEGGSVEFMLGYGLQAADVRRV